MTTVLERRKGNILDKTYRSKVQKTSRESRANGEETNRGESNVASLIFANRHNRGPKI